MTYLNKASTYEETGDITRALVLCQS
jgi:hypothetical protein